MAWSADEGRRARSRRRLARVRRSVRRSAISERALSSSATGGGSGASVGTCGAGGAIGSDSAARATVVGPPAAATDSMEAVSFRMRPGFAA